MIALASMIDERPEWITPELIERTRRAWAPVLGRILTDRECVDAIMHARVWVELKESRA